MRGQSHLCLGRYLAQQYMRGLPGAYVRAFLLGCIEPDRNPATYLKGSLRCQWLRGHNYRNARRFMKRISRRLENKDKLNLFDFYTLGKLIHYTADAFTYAHNRDFPTQLKNHMEYELQLQNYFLTYLSRNPRVDPMPAKSIMATISRYHREYERTEHSVSSDSRFALTACCCILAALFTVPVFKPC